MISVGTRHRAPLLNSIPGKFAVIHTMPTTCIGVLQDISVHLLACLSVFSLSLNLLRWLQFGIFSPIFRTHPSKSASNPRRIWVYPPYYYDIMRKTMLMRAALVPYIYTYARFAYDSGVCVCVCVCLNSCLVLCLALAELANFSQCLIQD